MTPSISGLGSTPTPELPPAKSPPPPQPESMAGIPEAWVKMFGPYGTPAEVRKFMDGVLNALDQQIAYELKRMKRALERMRKEQQ